MHIVQQTRSCARQGGIAHVAHVIAHVIAHVGEDSKILILHREMILFGI